MDIYLYVIIAILLLAIVDLWVGVANDAVNFLGSAIGSKAAPFRIILAVAAIGMLVGVTFSSGMMEVARKGIVNPEMFYFQELIIIFFAYAIGDLILLDLFNTFGLPTSTTVSLIFGLLGGGVAVSILKILGGDGNLSNLYLYINTARVLTFASAIIISIVLSFVFGSLIQYISRIIFTFNFEQTFRRWGGLWSAFAITSILYFIMMKGINGASFITPEVAEWIKQNTWSILGINIVFWTITFQILLTFTKLNILKGLVLAGTFSLAMAFAANDLVNFLGVPFAGISAYIAAQSSADPFSTPMAALNDPYRAETLHLLIAGVLMVVALYVSKKSKTVTKTAVSLGSQEEEVERFQSFALSRGLVRLVVTFFDIVQKIIPEKFKKYVASRFNKSQMPRWTDEKTPPPEFDLIRATVNLMVAAALISLGTSLKLPLSTTYVTFIVAMGTAFSDRAWGRDTAVYRVSGVLTVIGGWFITAFMAALIAATIVVIIWFTSFTGMAVLLVLTFVIIFRNTILHRRREKEFEEREKLTAKHQLSKEELFDNVIMGCGKFAHSLANLVTNCNDGILHNDLHTLKLCKQETKQIQKDADILISYISKTIKKLNSEELNKAYSFTDLVGYLNVLASLARRMAVQAYDYFDNNHRLLTNEQLNEISETTKLTNNLLTNLGNSIINREYFNQNYDSRFDTIRNQLEIFKLEQAKRINTGLSTTWQNLLYLSYIDYCERIALNSLKVGKAMKKFFTE
jgi:phosphate/sulfate permease